MKDTSVLDDRDSGRCRHCGVDLKELFGFLDFSGDLALVMDQNRRVLFVNRSLVEYVGAESSDQLVGRRPGEIFGCRNSGDSLCGTTNFCTNCRMNQVIERMTGTSTPQWCGSVSTAGGGLSPGEKFGCIIPRNDGNALHLDVCSSILSIQGGQGAQKYYVFAARDTTVSFMKNVVDRLFVHDLNNTIMKLQTYSQAMHHTLEAAFPDLVSQFQTLVDEMVDSVSSHQWISRSLESGQFKETSAIELEFTDTRRLLLEISSSFNCGFESPVVECDPDLHNVNLETVPGILKRILTNMVKNSLEDSEWKEKVTLGCKLITGSCDGAEPHERVRFWVRGGNQIPGEFRDRIFSPDFSTKGRGRGLGACSCKVLGERFLGGQVWFESTREEGTTFFLELPLRYQDSRQL